MCFPGLSLVKGNSKVCCTVCVLPFCVNIIFMGFDLVDKVKSVVKDIVLFNFTHHSCAKLNMMVLLLGVELWQLSHILRCSIGLRKSLVI